MKKRYQIIIFLFLFAMVVAFNKFLIKDYKAVQRNEAISSTYAQQATSSALRGNPVFYDGSKYIPTSFLISDKCNLSIWKGDKTTNKTKSSYLFQLSDLRYPFKVSKRKDDDIIFVEKANCLLEFKIDYSDGER